MTYEQSLENIRILLSLVRPIDGRRICFEFSTNFNFKILTKEIDIPDYVQSVIRHKSAVDLPFAQMYYEETGEDVLSYGDINGHWVINMATLRLQKFGSKEGFSIEKAQKQFLELTRIAKKS